MGYVIRNNKIQVARKVTLTPELKSRMYEPTKRQEEMKTRMLKRKKLLAVQTHGQENSTILA